MATLLGTIIADFETQLATKIAVGGTSLTLLSATDDDGVALPAGRYFFTIDGDNSLKEHIAATLSGTSLTAIKTVSRQGAETSGVLRAHRIGAKIKITDFGHLDAMKDLLAGSVGFNAATPLKYDGASTPTLGQYNLPDWDYVKTYADGLAIAGAPNASTTTKGIVEEATQAEVEAGTDTGGTGAKLFTPNSKNGAKLFFGYAADAGANDTYVITCPSVPTAYTEGMLIQFKANTANTGACTINVNSLGAKSLKVNKDLDPQDGYIKAGQIVLAQYDGTNFQILSVSGKPSVSQSGTEIYGASSAGSDTYAITLAPVPSAYVVGQVFRFKADVANTGTATLNVNSLGALTILRPDGTALQTGDIIANQIVEVVVYDGSNVKMLSPITSNPLAFAPNTDPAEATYYTQPIHLPVSGAVPLGWTLTNVTPVIGATGAQFSGFNSGLASIGLYGGNVSGALNFSNTKIVRFKFALRTASPSGSDRIAVGFTKGSAGGDFSSLTDTTQDRMAIVFGASSAITAVCADGSTVTTDDLTGATINNTTVNIYEIVWTPGVDVKFYVNGTLMGTITTSISTASGNDVKIGIGNNSANGDIKIISPIISFEK